MVLHSFTRFFAVHMPVTKAIETLSDQASIVERACQLHGLLIIVTSACVIAFIPEKAQIHQTLPLCALIVYCMGQFCLLFVITVGLLKHAQRFIGLPTGAIEAQRRLY